MDTGGFGVEQAPRECPGSPSWRSAACLEFQKRGLSERYRSGSETADCKRREGVD